MKPAEANKKLIILAVIVVVVAVTILLWPPSPPEYTVGDLGVLGRSSHAAAINDHGQIVGWSDDTQTAQSRAVLWNLNNSVKYLGPPPSQNTASHAYDINNKGQVVFTIKLAYGKNKVVFWDKDAGTTELGTLGGKSTLPYALNNQGQVVGWSMTSDGQKHAFIWDKENGMRDLGTLGGNQSSARDINDKGQVVGTSTLPSGQRRAFIWEEGIGMVDIGTLSGASSNATGINNHGQVIGTIESKDRQHGFIWEKNTGAKKLKLPGKRPRPRRINDSGQIIGYYGTRRLWSRETYMAYFLWDPNHGTIELDAIVRSKGRVVAGADINNKGWIAAMEYFASGKARLLILTPKAKSKTKDE